MSRKRGIRVSRLQTEADALKVGELVAAKYALSGSFVEMNGKLRINQSRLLLKDTETRNGVIHYIYPAITPDKWGGRK